MPADPNALAPAARARSTAAGDAPEELLRHYYLDRRGGGLGFYVDATIAAPAFRDHGDRLTAARNDPNAIRHMAAIAAHRGWSVVAVSGAPVFRREAWLEARALGLDVRGHRPSERDRAALRRRLDPDRQTRPAAPAPPRPRAPGREPGQAHLRAVEAVVRARVPGTVEQDRILAAARGRIADWLERGARFDERPHRRGAATERGRGH